MDKNGWVKVEEQLPPKATLVLFNVGIDSLYIGMLHHGRFEIWGLGRPEPSTDIKVTHWMELPSPPKTEQATS